MTTTFYRSDTLSTENCRITCYIFIYFLTSVDHLRVFEEIKPPDSTDNFSIRKLSQFSLLHYAMFTFLVAHTTFFTKFSHVNTFSRGTPTRR